MNRYFDGLTLDEIIEIIEIIYKQRKVYMISQYGEDKGQILEFFFEDEYIDGPYVDFKGKSFITTYYDEIDECFMFRDYRKTWSDKREDLEENIE